MQFEDIRHGDVIRVEWRREGDGLVNTRTLQGRAHRLEDGHWVTEEDAVLVSRGSSGQITLVDRVKPEEGAQIALWYGGAVLGGVLDEGVFRYIASDGTAAYITWQTRFRWAYLHDLALTVVEGIND